MFGKSWEMIKRGMAVALSVSLLAGAMSVSSSLPTAAASTKRVEVGTKGKVTINLDGREVWQAAADAMQKAQPVTGDIADRIMAQTGSNGNPVVLEDDIYKMELPAKALKGLPIGLGMEMYISAGAEDVAEDYTAAEEGEAAAVVAEVASASDLEATGVAEKPVRDFFASSMFSLIKENDEAAPAGGAAAAGGEGYELNGSEHIYFVLSNATDQDVNYTVKLGDLEILKTKVLKSHGDTTGVIGASVSDLIGVPASTSNMVRATESDMATASNLMEEAELTDDVVAKVVRTTLKNFFIIYRSEETALGTKAMVVTTADMKFKSKDGGVFTTRGDKMVLAVRDIDKNSEEYKQAAATLQNNNVDHADFAAVDISFRKGGADEDYEPCQGQIVNVRIETKAIENFDPESMSIQHHLDDGSLETVAGTTKKTVVEISDDAAEAVNNTVAVTEDQQTEITVEKKEDENVYTFDEEANKAAMEAQLSTAGKSEFKMEVGDGETALTNDVKESGAPKKASAAQTEVKKNSVTKTISSAVDANGVKTEVQEEQGNGDIKVEDGKVVADFVVDSFSIYTIIGQQINTVEYLSKDGNTYEINLDLTEVTNIPEGAVLEVKELSEKESEKYIEKAATAIDSKVDAISYAKLFDISIVYNGEKLQPDGPVKVEVTLQDKEKDIYPRVVHFGKKTEVLSASEDGNTVEFSTNSFSVFAVLGTEIIIAPNGEFKFENERYAVTVSYSEEAKIPLGTELTVTEITPNDDLYWDLWKQTVDKINEGIKRENPDLPDPRKGLTDAAFFDITLKYEGNKIEPAVPLGVRIEYKNGGILTPQNENTLVVHFAEEGTELIENVQTEKSKMDTSKFPGVLKNSDAVESFTYTQGSFSIVGTGSTGDYIEINDGNIDGQPMELYAPKLAAGRASSIAASKTVTDSDEDGIYELALNVTGASESSSSTTVNKSNVVIVIDTSGSMNEYVYNTYTYSADTYDESVNYFGVSEYGYYFNVFYWPGGNYYGTYLSAGWYLNYYGLYSYSGPVYVRQTRLQATKAAAVDLVDALLGNNKNETTPDGTSLNDIVEISLVTFAGAMNNSTNGYLRTYNNTHFTGTKNSTSASQLKSYINNLSAVGGTNWEQALKAAKTSADTYAGQAGENTAIIFLTDGKPTFYGSNDSGNGQEDDSNVKTCWNNAADDARNIVSAGYTLYNIFAFGTDTGSNSGSNYLKALTNYAYTGSGTYENYETTQFTRDYFFDAKDTAALTKAFQAIIDNINNTVGYGGVEFEDGVTVGVTNTSVTVDGTVHDETFRYTVRNGNNIVYSAKIDDGVATFTIAGKEGTYTDNSPETVVTVIDPDDPSKNITSTVYSVEVDGKTYSMSPAVINKDTGLVDWDLAGLGILENGYTYTVAFDVWPNQYAYDLVADLNNGVKTLDQIKAELIAEKGEEKGTALYNQIVNALQGPDASGQYSILTNWEQKVKYYSVDTTEDSQGGSTTTYTKQPDKELPNPNPVALTSKPLPMSKVWNSNLSPDQIGNLLYEDYPTNSVPTEYKVKLHVWKADTASELENLIQQYAGDPTAASEHDYIEKTLGWNESANNYVWSDTLSIAPGTMISLQTAVDMGIDTTSAEHQKNIVTYDGEKYYIIEKGHYYYVTEDNIDWHFELETVVYHPMMVDGRLKNVTFVTDDEGNVTGVEDIVDMTQVTATNSKTAELDITKKIVDETGKMTQAQMDAETFTYKVTLTVPKDADMSHSNALEWVARYNDDASASNRYYVFGYQKSEDKSLLGLEDDVERFNEKVYGQYTVSYPGGGATLDEIFTGDENGTTKSGTIYITLKQNEIIRFTNLPSGTQYRIEEMYNNLYQADPSRDEDADLGENAPASNIEANGYAVTIATKNGEPTVSDSERVVTGTIKELNKRYYNQFTNTLSKAIDVELKGTKHLEGYEWSGEKYFFRLDKEGNAPLPTGHDRRTSFYLTNESGTEDKTYSFGRIRFTEAGTYVYKVYETDKLNGTSIAGDIKAVNGKAVQYGPVETITIVVVEDTNGVLSVDSVRDSNNHTVWDSDNLVATTTITNTVPKTNITASKQWLKADGTTELSDLPKGTSVQFKLFADNEDTGKVVSLDGVTDENGESAAWVASFNDLASHKIVDGQPVLITYTVDEGVLPAGFERVTTGSVGNDGVIQNKLTTSTLSVSKTVTGNMGDKYKQFDFTLELYEKAAETSAPVPLTDDDLVLTADQKKALKDEYDFTYDSSKKAWTFKLRNGQTIDIAGIPYGTYCNVEEDAANKEGYKTTYTISGTSSTLPRGIQLKDPATVAVENYKDSTVPTGIHTDSTIWRWLIGACFLMFFGSALYGRRKRRQ